MHLPYWIPCVSASTLNCNLFITLLDSFSPIYTCRETNSGVNLPLKTSQADHEVFQSKKTNLTLAEYHISS